MKDKIEKQNELHYKLNRYLNSVEEAEGNEEIAKEISNGYKNLFCGWNHGLEQNLGIFKINTNRLDISEYKTTPYYKTLFKLNKFVKNKLSPFVSYLFIHGSVATKDYEYGFSDIDTYIFIKKETCSNYKKLKKLKHTLGGSEKIFKEIDSNSHHGFLFCNEADLNYYCNAYMPIPVFRHAKILLGKENIVFNLRDSKKEYKQSFERFANILLDQKRFDIKNINFFDFKYFISVLLLLPTLFLQAKDSILYKKYSFKLYSHPILEKATLVRKKFNKKTLNELIKILGFDYLKQTENMIGEMKMYIEKYEIQRNSYINKPSKIPLDTYKKARLELINNFKKNPDVISVYEYGKIRSPGISDLDLIIVTHGDLKSSSPQDYCIKKEKFPIASKVVTGTLMVMCKQDFADILFLDEINLNLLYGENIRLNKINNSDIKNREIASVIDWLPERMARFIYILKQPKFDAQKFLLYSRSFCYTLEKISKLTKKSLYANLTKEVTEARSLWLENKRTDLRYLLKKLIYAGYYSLEEFADKFFIKQYNSNGRLFLFPWQEINFTNKQEEIDPEIAISFSTDKLASIPVNSKILPHFLIYSKQKGMLAEQMKIQFKIPQTNHNKSLPINKNYADFLRKKMAIATRYANFLARNNFKSGLYKFGFYFVNKK